MGFLAHFVITAFALWAATQIVSGIAVRSMPSLLLAALIFGLVNAVVRPVLVLLSLPLTILTLGLFMLVINAAMLGLTAALSDRFTVDGFLAALLGGFLIALFSWIAELVLPLKVRGH